MSKLLGQNIEVGIGIESTRGTAVAPQVWVGGRSPSGIMMMKETIDVKETGLSGVSNLSSEPSSFHAEGELEFNVRANSIGYMLLSLLGAVSTVDNGGGSYTHTFTIDISQGVTPALTLALAQSGFQDYHYALGIVTGLTLNAPLDDLVYANATFMAATETEVADMTVTKAADQYFRQQDTRVRIGADIAAAKTATPYKTKNFDMAITSETIKDQYHGELYPVEFIKQSLAVAGNFTLDYEGETDYDRYKNNDTVAAHIAFTRGADSIEIDLPAVIYNTASKDAALDSVVSQAFGFTAYYDATESQAIEVRVTNSTPTYAAA